MKLDQDVMDILRNWTRLEQDGFGVKLTRNLNRSEYTKVNAALEALGGQWNRKAKCHMFPVCRPLDAVLSGEVVEVRTKKENQQELGQFDTPTELAKHVCDLANLDDGCKFLEPSAGLGNIALLAGFLIGFENITCVEVDEDGAERLRLLALDWMVIRQDFLKIDEHNMKPVDRIVMNPPFSRQADIDHVLHAWKFLKPGGILVAIMSPGWTFRENKKSEQFQQFYYEFGTLLEENDRPEYQFEDTNIKTITVKLEKPE